MEACFHKGIYEIDLMRYVKDVMTPAIANAVKKQKTLWEAKEQIEMGAGQMNAEELAEKTATHDQARAE